MPTYVYSTRDRSRSEEFYFPLGKAPKRVKDRDGTHLYRDIAAEHSEQPNVRCSNWPMKSYALGVNPAQCAQAEAEALALGVPTRFDRSTGDALLESPSHRRKLARALGLHDRNAGFSDPVPD